MKVNVIKDKCIGCGNCVSLTEGAVFDFNDEGLAEEIVDAWLSTDFAGGRHEKRVSKISLIESE